MNLREVETLVDLVHVARISEVTIRANGRRITIRKDPAAAPSREAPIEVIRMPAEAPAPQSAASVTVAPTFSGPLITAPMVGVFHAAEPPIGIAAHVEAGQVVGAIESMRLMNDVRSDIAGVVEAILVEDGMAVEYGQPIFRLGTSSPGEESEGPR